MGVFKTTGHHTFEDTGSENDLINAPYPCTDINAFLGSGYYFWDDSPSLAKFWGQKWYLNKRKQYHVAETAIECKREVFFDLVGDRTHQKYLLDMAKKLANRRPNKSSWPIGRLIELLKILNRRQGDFFEKFPFKVIRAADDSATDSAELLEFAGDKRNFADLHPCYIICVLDKKEILLAPLFIVHTSKKKT